MGITKHILLGVLFVAIGIWFIINTYRDLSNLKEYTPLRPDYWGGYIAGAGLVIAGILEMFGCLKW